MSEEGKQCDCIVNNTCTNLLYYFHSDHLGSSSFISDNTGSPYQFLLYLPFGETMAEQKVADFGTPYQFTGQELDAETGLYNYGARYYDPRISLFFGVDPLADHPNQVDKSPYAYAWNNPVYYTDPDGRCPTCPTAALGAVVGGVIGGASSIIGSWWSGEDISWSAVGKATITGAVSGAIVGSGAGLVGAMGGLLEAGAGGAMVTVGTGIASGLAGETASQGLDMIDGTRDVGDFDGLAIGESGAVGGVLNVVAAGAGQALKEPIKKVANSFLGASKEAIKTAQKSAGNYVKSNGGNKAALRGARSSAKSQVKQSAMNNINVATQVGVTTVGTATRNIENNIAKKILNE